MSAADSPRARWSALVARAFRWCTDFLCSHDGKPSHPKLLAWAVLGIFAAGGSVPSAVVVALVASSFGLKTFQMFLQRATIAASSTDTKTATTIETTTRAIVERVQARREPADGIEAAE